MNTPFKRFAPFAFAACLMGQTPQAPQPPHAAPAAPTDSDAPMAGRAFRHAGFLAKKLNLSDEQKASMKAIAQKHKDEMKAKHQAVRDARQAFHTTLADTNAKEADILAAHQVLSQKSLDMILAARGLRQEMRAQLTLDQQVQADKLRDEFKTQRQERMMHLRKGFGLDG